VGGVLRGADLGQDRLESRPNGPLAERRSVAARNDGNGGRLSALRPAVGWGKWSGGRACLLVGVHLPRTRRAITRPTRPSLTDAVEKGLD
jgi:hypothetical protein